MWSQKVSIKFFLYSETQMHEVFQDFFSRENSPTLERSQEQESDSMCKGIKILRSLQLVETEFLLNR